MCALHESQLWPTSRDLYDAWGTKEFFFAVAKKPDLNASFIIYTFIHTIYIYIYMYKYIKSFKHKFNGVLIRQMHFDIFYFQDTN